MLVMLVIFMITAPLLKTGVEVDLPQASAKPIKDPPSEPLVLSVNAEGEYFLSVGADPEAALDEQSLMALVAAVIRVWVKRRFEAASCGWRHAKSRCLHDSLHLNVPGSDTRYGLFRFRRPGNTGHIY